MSETHVAPEPASIESDREVVSSAQHDVDASAQAPLDPLRVLILAQIGTIGKRTVGACVLQPQLKGSFYSIETFNQDAARYGLPIKRYTPDEDDLEAFQIDLTNDPNHAIIDIGTSALDAFLQRMALDNMVQDFQYVVSVADTSLRGQDEAIATWETLMDLGFSPDQYRLVLNRAKPRKAPQEQYPRLFGYKRNHPEFWISPECLLPEVRAFNSTIKNNVSWELALSPGVDFLMKSRVLRAQGREAEAQEATNRAVLQKWTASAVAYTEGVWTALDIKV